MAAVLIPTPDRSTLPHRPAPAPRPRLVVLEGGRSDRAMARTYVRRRVAAALVVLVIAVVALGLGRAALAAVTPQAPGTATATASPGHVVIVRPGDSFWSIARRLHPAGDVRALVDRLSAAHGPAALQPGDRIVVPG